MTKSKIYLDRIAKVQKLLPKEKVGTLCIQNPIDLFYLLGMHCSLGHLYITKKSATLFVDGRYKEAAEMLGFVQVQELGLDKEAFFLQKEKVLGFDGSAVSYADFIQLKKLAKVAKCKLKSSPTVMTTLRLLKDPFEIRLMKKSAILAYDAYQYIRKKLRVGVTEKELAQELEIYCLQKGAEGMSFPPIIAFGKNTALPHHHPGGQKLKENDLVLFDLGVMLEGYASDMTRVDFVGKKNPKLFHLYEVNKAAQKVALSKCKPGVRLKELDVAARKVMANAGLEEYFIHSLGHGIGLEVHEYPRIKFDGTDCNATLQPGMAITIEPGLYLPGIGGVRYEDTIIVTEKGYTNLYPES